MWVCGTRVWQQCGDQMAMHPYGLEQVHGDCTHSWMQKLSSLAYALLRLMVS
jgi:hypothetical protein